MRPLLTIVAIFTFTITSAQVPDTLKFEDAPIDTTCRAVANVSHTYLASLKFTQIAQISTTLADWEETCKSSEPLLRAKILLQLQRGLKCAGLVQKFIPEYFDEFRWRVSDYVYLDLYEYDRERYGYVPFESAFDHWTEEWALQLIDQIPYGTDEFLACALFTGNIDKFDELMSSGDFNETLTWRMMDENSKNRWDPMLTGGFHIGYWHPVGTMSNAFNGTVEFGGAVGARINRTSGVRVEAIMKLRPMINRDGVTLLIDRAFEETMARNIFSIGAQVIKTLPINGKYFADFGGGVEFIDISTRYPKPKKHPDDEDTFYSISAYNVFGKAAIMTTLQKGNGIGLYVTMNYAPFNNDKDLGKVLGDTFVTVGLQYSLRP